MRAKVWRVIEAVLIGVAIGIFLLLEWVSNPKTRRFKWSWRREKV